MFENLKKAVERAQKEQEEKAYERACPAIMRALYAKEDERPEGVTRREWLGYGSGYGALPAFEGGVGVRALCEVLTTCGLYVNCTQASDKTYYVRITEGGAKK